MISKFHAEQAFPFYSYGFWIPNEIGVYIDFFLVLKEAATILYSRFLGMVCLTLLLFGLKIIRAVFFEKFQSLVKKLQESSSSATYKEN